MNINIICVGNLKENYLKEGINEYSKRFGAYANLNIIEVPESSKGTVKDIKGEEGGEDIKEAKGRFLSYTFSY